MKQEQILELLDNMSLKEKVDQLLQLNGSFYEADNNDVLTGPARELGVSEDDIRMAGSILGVAGAERLMKIQKEYMKKQPHHIPMLFMHDIIHGMKTVFPATLGIGATFEPELARKCASVAAKEAAVSGIHVTFSPMVDLVRDARWGRVMESTGEDPFLNGRFAEEQVKGFQGEDMGKPYKVCACIKHFAGYGASVAGRDYNTVELSESTLRNQYLTAYKKGIEAGAGMVMTAFNTINGIPASTNKWLMRHILRGEMAFNGVLISDFGAIQETITHGYCSDAADAAHNALEAGVDIDMMTSVYASNLCQLVEDGIISEKMVDDAVFRVLELKNKLGLFENPYKDADPEKENEIILCPEHRRLAREVAGKSMVLLKNEGILPINKEKKIAFIGPYINNKEIISFWAVEGETKDCITIEEAAREIWKNEEVTYHKGSGMLGDGVEIIHLTGPVREEISKEEQQKMLDEAVEAAKDADIVVMAIGEHYIQSGEAASRGMIEIPEVQMNLFREVRKVNEKIAVVLFNGRPLDIREISRDAKAVLVAWLPGTEGGHAVVDILTGAVNPSGKLPMSFPYSVGQCPVYYNEFFTGRPEDVKKKQKFLSRYQDIPNTPLYPFGYGLSYTEFAISPVVLSKNKMQVNDTIIAKSKIKNTGYLAGTEVVQLYIRDHFGSVVRPVKELKDIRKVYLQPGEETEVAFEITNEMLSFVRQYNSYGSEPGVFTVWIGNSSTTENAAEFELV